MLIVSSQIQIGQWVFDSCVDVEIVSDINSLTGTCKITIPRRFKWKGKDIAMGDEPYIVRKDKVIVKLGYNGNLSTQFVGYVTDIRAGVPVKIECEDSMFLLKQNPIEKLTIKPGLTLEQWLNILLPADMERVCNNVVMGGLRITKKTPAEVLDWVKNNYGLQCYFRLKESNGDYKPVLYVGLAYSQLIEDRRECEYRFAHNIIDPYSLIYKREEDVRLRVKAIGVDRNNTKKEVQVGDADGELRTVHYYNVDVPTLRQRAEEDIRRFKYTGYRGSFQTFGEPSIRIGDIANIVGNDYNPDGKYLVSKVTKKLGVSIGYKQTIEPQQIVNDKRNT